MLSEPKPLYFSFREDMATRAGALGESKLFLKEDLSSIFGSDTSSIITSFFKISPLFELKLFLSDSRSSLALRINYWRFTLAADFERKSSESESLSSYSKSSDYFDCLVAFEALWPVCIADLDLFSFCKIFSFWRYSFSSSVYLCFFSMVLKSTYSRSTTSTETSATKFLSFCIMNSITSIP